MRRALVALATAALCVGAAFADSLPPQTITRVGAAAPNAQGVQGAPGMVPLSSAH